MEDQALKHFITEEIFITPDSEETEPNDALNESNQIETVENPSLDHYKLAIATEELSSEEEILLGKILSAVGQDLKETPTFYYPTELNFTFEKLLVFGEKFQAYSNIKKYSVTGAHYQYMVASKLSVIAVSKEEKTQLWMALKSWFDV